MVNGSGVSALASSVADISMFSGMVQVWDFPESVSSNLVTKDFCVLCGISSLGLCYIFIVQKDFSSAWPGMRNLSSSFPRECS